MPDTTTVILGGGYGGLVAANAVRSLLPKSHRVVVVDRRSEVALGASNMWVMMGETTPAAASGALAALERRDIDFIKASATSIDAGTRTVTTAEAGTIQADFLVVALGADLNMGAVEGLAEAAHTFYTMDSAVELRQKIADWSGGEIVMLIPKTPYKCPPAPFEALMLLHSAFQGRGIRDRTRLSVYTVEPVPMVTAGPVMQQLVGRELAARDITLHTSKAVERVDGPSQRVMFADGTEARYDLLLAVPPHEAPQVVRDSGLAKPGGWIPVDPQTLEVGGGEPGRLFAIGDCAAVPLPGRFKPDAPLMLPKAGVFAEREARIVASRVAAAALGQTAADGYDGTGFCFIEVGGGQGLRADAFMYESPEPRMVATPIDASFSKAKHESIERWMAENLL